MKKLKTITLSALLVIALTGLVRAGAGEKPKIKPYKLDTCAVCGMKLADMGKPFTFEYKDREIKVCDKGEAEDFKKTPDKFIKKIEEAEAKLKK